MQKKFRLVLILLTFFSLPHLMAQTIPNPGFENWSGGLPVGWYGDTTFIVQSNDAYSGSYAAKLVVGLVEGFYVSSPLTTGSANSADYAATGRPDSLYFWYIFNSPGKEPFLAQTGGLNSTTGLTAVGVFEDSITNTVYKQGVIAYQYSAQSGDLDTIAITFSIYALSGTDSGDVPNTYLIIDDLSFNGISGVNNLAGNGEAMIESIQPNPASDRTSIIYNLPSSANVSLEVYDITGRMVSTLVNTKQTPGTYKAILQTNSLPAGNYLCKLNADGIISTEKIVVVK